MLGHSACSSVVSLNDQSPSTCSIVSSPDSGLIPSSPATDSNNPLLPTSDLCCSSPTVYSLFPVDPSLSVESLISANKVPLFLKNPCFRSPNTLRHNFKTPQQIHSPKLLKVQQSYGKNENSATDSSTASSRLISEQGDTLPLSLKKRANSMQTFKVDCDQLSSYGPLKSRADSTQLPVSPISTSTCSSVYCDHQIRIDSLSVTAINLLNETALSKLSHLYEQGPIDFLVTDPTQWRSQMVKHMRNLIRQVRVKAPLSRITSFSPSTDAALSTPESLYGAPLSIIASHTSDGSPLPRFVHDMMEWLSKNGHSSDGIFRKNGQKMRITAIRDLCALLMPNQPMPRHLLDEFSATAAYDIADALKEYFRKLPDCLMTDRISTIVKSLVRELTPDKHLAALQFCILLLPTEHREALLILLRFLNGFARHSLTTQMTSASLATCWLPTLFQIDQFEMMPVINNGAGGGASKNRRLTRRKTIAIPMEKERKLEDQVKDILTLMIDHWDCLQYLPNNLAREINDGKMEACHDLEMPIKNGRFDFSEDIQRTFKQQLDRLKEDYLSKWKHWDLQRVYSDGSQLFTRTINDMIPLKEFRVQTSIAASPNLIMAAILHNRHLWDAQVNTCSRTGPSGNNFDILKIGYKASFDDECKKHTYLARLWRYGEYDSNGISMVMERSIVPKNVSRTIVSYTENRISIYESEFLLEQVCPGHSYVTYISRADFCGKSSEWYDRVYGGILFQHLQSLKRHISQCQNEFRGTIV